ncbi:3-dehydroquinate synthase [Alkalihalobacillus sp. CinArs1]|uniref:3-dehydroquinate synthase n=1 Tax=Alkalihalobacillus sp. CinArs1 TaxID=2995314 RepID=UPI0022DD0F05|nr:3-dehydroquinate synthase [Alkalihalobacillus sp. CinArs1]
MESMVIDTTNRSYPVYIGVGISRNWRKLIDQLHPYSKYFLITDETVSEQYLSSFLDEDKDITVHVIPSGETSKSMEQYAACLTAMLEAGLDRKSCVIALGGGVVGDLAGFAAATYMRGIDFVQVPTTLLAHDSSVGGKTGINHAYGKNVIGAFHQPAAVIYDVNFLRTLPIKEWRSGFSEVIKHAFIQDEAFLDWLMSRGKRVESYTDGELEYIIKKGISIKGKIVKEDEREKGVRAHLNFGHTLGHAIEAELGYGVMTHGEAVAIGMIYALKLSESYYSLNLRIHDIEKWFTQMELPTAVPKSLNANRLLMRMKKDKKAENQSLTFVLLKKIGEPQTVTLDDNAALKLLETSFEGGE